MCICRSLAVNVNTTHVERAVIVVALVTTSSRGWQEPSSLDMSVKVRKTNYMPKLHTDIHMRKCSPSTTIRKQIVPSPCSSLFENVFPEFLCYCMMLLYVCIRHSSFDNMCNITAQLLVNLHTHRLYRAEL